MAECPYCKAYFPKKDAAVEHLNRKHGPQLEESGMDACQTLYYSTHGTLRGPCMACGGPTDWNYHTGKPYKVCKDPKCREQLRAAACKNMTRVYGKTTLLDDMDQQRKMQHNRPTAGNYKFADGGSVDYLSKPEESFLRFCDQVMDLPSWAIQVSPEVFTYYDPKADRNRQYDPDYYLPDYNLLVEIKDGGAHTNTNPAFIKETKYKVALKDAVMRKQTKYNFIKIVDNNFGPFVELLYQIVHMQGPEGMKKKKNLVVITEHACYDIDEHMDFVAITENFEKMYAVMATIAEVPIAFGISESSGFERLYLYDYTTNTVRETTREDPILEECTIDTYRYVGNVAPMNIVMRKHISACISEAAGGEMVNPLFAMRECGIYFTHPADSNNRHQRMNFVHLKHTKGM